MSIVAIVGRPNVGKSTLFNRLVGTRDAIIHESSGVTRDRHYGKTDWNGIEFSVIDTGGYVSDANDVFEIEINKQVKLAIEESDVILFMVDVLSGITDLDDSVATLLRKCKKPILVVANKIDTFDRINDAYIFYKLGVGELFCISSVNGTGTGELMDAIVAAFPNKEKEEEEDVTGVPKFAIVGRPNVGKSSIINAFLGEERNIVTPVAGTTRDSVFTRYNKFGQDFFLVDTAGLRKKGKVSEDIEFYSVMRSIRTIEYADVCLLMIDAERGVEAQDLNIFHLIQRNHKGVVMLVNKWDLIEKDTMSTKRITEEIQQKCAPFNDFPIVFTSALTKQRIHKAIEEAVKVYENRIRKIPTHKLNEVMLAEVEKYQPPSEKGKFIKIKFFTQLPTHYPSFAVFCNLPQYVKESYRRYLENRLRENFDLHGVPVEVYMRQK
jgi:GTPase